LATIIYPPDTSDGFFPTALFLQCKPNGRRAEGFYPRSEFSANFGPSGSHGCRQVVHFNPGGINTDFFQYDLEMIDPLSRIFISFQEMTLTFKSPGHEYSVYTPLKGLQNVHVIQLARAGQTNDLDIGRVGKPHYTGEIRSRKSAIMAGKGQYFGFPALRNFLRFFNRRLFFLGFRFF
jgi:hypothetical protein